jgi:hypothetical protein
MARRCHRRGIHLAVAIDRRIADGRLPSCSAPRYHWPNRAIACPLRGHSAPGVARPGVGPKRRTHECHSPSVVATQICGSRASTFCARRPGGQAGTRFGHYALDLGLSLRLDNLPLFLGDPPSVLSAGAPVASATAQSAAGLPERHGRAAISLGIMDCASGGLSSRDEMLASVGGSAPTKDHSGATVIRRVVGSGTTISPRSLMPHAAFSVLPGGAIVRYRPRSKTKPRWVPAVS